MYDASSFCLVFFLGLILVCNGFDNDTTTETAAGITAPMEFPKNASDYNIMQNKTVLENLNRHEVLESEVADMNENGLAVNRSHPTTTPTDEKLAGSLFTKENFKDVLQQAPQQEAAESAVAVEETEPIQTGNNEDDQSPRMASSAGGDGGEVGPVPVVQGQLAAILAGVFVLIAAVGYSGLLAYRRYLENRYGSRDLLVNEDIGPFSL